MGGGSVDRVSADEGRVVGDPGAGDALDEGGPQVDWEEAGDRSTRRVLVIEDDPHITDLLSDVLSGDGYTVTSADSVLGAATLIRRFRPCAIVLDLGLPYRSGASLLSDLKADPDTAHIAVIVVSALPETLTPERRALAAKVLAKPISIRDLLKAVHDACPPT